MSNKNLRKVEVRSTKKLDSIKGIQALSLNEMKEVEGGAWPVVLAVAIYLLATQKAY